DWIFRLDENFDIAGEDFYDSPLFAHSIVNAVPLSPEGSNFAYLSVRQFYAKRFILFQKKNLQGRHTTLSQAPQHFQLTPRNLVSNTGTVKYEGSLGTPGYYDEMLLKVYRNDTLIHTYSDPTPQDFSFQVEIPAELANYTFRLLGVRNGVEEPEAEACDVVAGDAYIIQGQSNALAGNPYDPEDTIPHAYRYHKNPFVRNFGLKYVSGNVYIWHREDKDEGPFADNKSGQSGLVLGEKIAEEHGVPVAILNGGIGGISIDNMLPDPADPHSTAHSYGRFYQRVARSGLQDHFRAILFFQGETNAQPGYNETVESYKNKYLQLRAAWQEDFTYEREYLFQIRPGCWEGNFHIIQEAHRQLAMELPDAAIMSTTGMNHDGCHYHYFNGHHRAGEDIYRLLAHDFYGAAPLPDRFPPAVDSAWFSGCDRQEITLRLQHEGDEYFWTPGWEADFRLEGSTGVVVESGQVAGNTVVLSLSDSPAPGFTGLTYTGHSGGSEASVKNANGIGLLAFYDYPVAPPTGSFGLAIEREGNTLTVAEEEASAYQWIGCTSGEAIPGASERSYTLVEDGVYAVIVSEGACTDTSACFEAQLPTPGQAAYPDPVFTEDFRQESGWQAGDATISAPLPDGRVLWLFGDSYVDRPYTPADTSLHCWFNKNNALVIQDSAGLSYHMTLVPSTPGHFYWPGKGFYHEGKVYIFLFERTFSGGNLTFVGSRYAELSYPGLELLGVHAIPNPQGIEFGKAAFVDHANGWLYVYGSKKFPFWYQYYAARCPLNNLMQEWSYWDGSAWATQPNLSTNLFSSLDGCPSFSVFPYNGKYFLLSQENGYLTCGLGRDIKLFVADEPQGPFSFLELVYTVEDTYEGLPLATYNAQAHPGIGGDLLVSYNLNDVNLANSGCPRQCNTSSRFNADTYRPKFVRMPWDVLPAGKPSPGNEQVNLMPDESPSFHIWPNPSRDGQAILAGKLEQEGRLLIRIFSPDGKLISQSEQLAPAGPFSETLRLPGTPGLYLVSVQNETGERQVLKVLRMRD
ncbi:MAG: T9SS type A sorting domain-containing protein, partial [Phaeodactylibacter sp.]|nr:T9SS type A sorting domain-containing protein [Phaeodactylibacter sp.]